MSSFRSFHQDRRGLHWRSISPSGRFRGTYQLVRARSDRMCGPEGQTGDRYESRGIGDKRCTRRNQQKYPRAS